MYNLKFVAFISLSSLGFVTLPNTEAHAQSEGGICMAQTADITPFWFEYFSATTMSRDLIKQRFISKLEQLYNIRVLPDRVNCNFRNATYQQTFRDGEILQESPLITARLARLPDGWLNENSNDIDDTDINTLQVYWAPGNNNPKGGYSSALVVLSYKFIACAGEVQVAYRLRANSAVLSAWYFRTDGTSFQPSGNERPNPPSIAFQARVSVPGTTHLTFVSDQFAGPSLGMGCFDGQTQPIGTVARLIGPNATPAQIRTYLSAASLRDGQILPFEPLTVPSYNRH